MVAMLAEPRHRYSLSQTASTSRCFTTSGKYRSSRVTVEKWVSGTLVVAETTIRGANGAKSMSRVFNSSGMGIERTLVDTTSSISLLDSLWSPSFLNSL